MTSKARLFRAALKANTRLHTLTYSALVGLFLGLLDDVDRASIDEGYYDEAHEVVEGVARRYTDEEMVRSGLFDWERRVVDEYFEPGCSVAVVGAGSGREVLALLEEGFDAVGSDPHSGFVREGQRVLERAGFPGRLRVSARNTLAEAGGGAGAVIVGWGAYSLIAPRRRRVSLLQQARSHVAPGSPVLISFQPRSGDPRRLILAQRVGAVVSRLRGAEAPELGDWHAPMFFHYFTRAEVEAELRAAGFDPVAFAAEPYGHAVGRAV